MGAGKLDPYRGMDDLGAPPPKTTDELGLTDEQLAAGMDWEGEVEREATPEELAEGRRHAALQFALDFHVKEAGVSADAVVSTAKAFEKYLEGA